LLCCDALATTQESYASRKGTVQRATRMRAHCGRVGAVTVAAFVENLSGEDHVLEYVSQCFSGSPFGNFSLAAPDRRYGVSVK